MGFFKDRGHDMTTGLPYGASAAPETQTPTTEQAALIAALARLEEMQREVRELCSKLPPLTFAMVASAETVWNSAPAQIVEGGYYRWTDLTGPTPDSWCGDDQGGWMAHTDGWDDMSEGGAYEYVEVDGLPYAMPEDVSYD